MRIAFAALLLSTATTLFAQPSAPAPAPPPPAAKLDAMAWLVGYWEGDGLGGKVEDVWMPPRDGVMLGAFRLTKADGKGFYELFAIEEFEGSLRFVVKHFHPDWVGWEEKDQALKLPLRRISEREALFGGLLFRREGNEAFVAELAMRMKDGTTRTEVLRFRRKPL